MALASAGGGGIANNSDFSGRSGNVGIIAFAVVGSCGHLAVRRGDISHGIGCRHVRGGDRVAVGGNLGETERDGFQPGLLSDGAVAQTGTVPLMHRNAATQVRKSECAFGSRN